LANPQKSRALRIDELIAGQPEYFKIGSRRSAAEQPDN
jgi:hypothetical protein